MKKALDYVYGILEIVLIACVAIGVVSGVFALGYIGVMDMQAYGESVSPTNLQEKSVILFIGSFTFAGIVFLLKGVVLNVIRNKQRVERERRCEERRRALERERSYSQRRGM